MAAQNIILDNGQTNQLTVYTSRVEEIQNKPLSKVTTPVSSGKWANGPNATKIIDLLRRELRFNVDGYIESTDRVKFRNLMTKGGTFTLTYNDEVYNVNFEKFSIIQKPEDDTENTEPDTYDVKFSVLWGEDF